MGMFSWIREGLTTPPELPDDGRLSTLEYQLEEANASLATLQALQREDAGWAKLADTTARDLTREGLREAARLCRVMFVINPLIKRGLALRAAYVWGQGVGVTARATGVEKDEQPVNDVVQAFLDHDGNRANLTGAQAHVVLENALGTDGNVFVACFTNPITGWVNARTIDPDEISDIITNPDDASEPWFFRRDFVRTRVGERTGRTTSQQETIWYPALRHSPARKLPLIDGNPVQWDAPIYHIKVNALRGGKWGIGDAYAAIPWARGYKEFLEDWASLVRALSRFAFRMSSKRGAANQARASLAKLQDGPAGATAHMSPDATLEAVPKTGATIDSESGRPIATMVASALGVPVTALLSDPGQTGARAVAETLNQPTRLEMKNRQEVWTEAYRAILGHVIDQAVLAPQGSLKGGASRDPWTGEQVVTVQGMAEKTLDIVWPDLDETPIETLIAAITDADATGKVPPLVILRLLLRALRVRDVDEIIDGVTDENGEWIDPRASAGQAAIDAFNRGEDPAAALRQGE